VKQQERREGANKGMGRGGAACKATDSRRGLLSRANARERDACLNNIESRVLARLPLRLKEWPAIFGPEALNHRRPLL
jgi:hypothetical protein